MMYTDLNKQMRHLTELKKSGLLGNNAFYASKSEQVKIIYNGLHLFYQDFMKLFPNLTKECLV